MERAEHHFGAFLGEGFWGNIEYPAAPSSPGPFVLLLNLSWTSARDVRATMLVCHGFLEHQTEVLDHTLQGYPAQNFLFELIFCS